MATALLGASKASKASSSTAVRHACSWFSEGWELLRYEWSADRASLASDGQHWRSVYGGSRLVRNVLRCSPGGFLVFRLLVLSGVTAIFGLQLHYHPPNNRYWLLYFENWVSSICFLYFLLTTLLTMIATCTTNGISRTTPAIVRLTEIAYGVLLPGTITNFLFSWCVTYAYRSHCIPAVVRSDQQKRDALMDGGMMGLFLLDTFVNRQPYYASFHALIGAVAIWGYLGFTAIYEAAGGVDEWGHSYIYRCLDWSYPIYGGNYNAAAKLITIDYFVMVPLFNLLFWTFLWARRRTAASAKPVLGRVPGAPHLALLGSVHPTPTPSRRFFEMAADRRDLSLDGRHWQAQFGGSSGRGPKMGAFVCFGPMLFALVRLAFAVGAVGFFCLRLAEFGKQYDGRWGGALIYFENVTLLISMLYFVLAFVLTAAAALATGAEASAAPKMVWVTWALSGALLPASFISAALFCLVTDRDNPSVWSDNASQTFDWAAAFGTLGMVLADAYINRQPYYATFHAAAGAVVCWVYLAFLILFTASGGVNAAGLEGVYPEFRLASTLMQDVFTPAKVVMVELFILVPILNAMYWCMLWARRRARVVAKHGQQRG